MGRKRRKKKSASKQNAPSEKTTPKQAAPKKAAPKKAEAKPAAPESGPAKQAPAAPAEAAAASPAAAQSAAGKPPAGAPTGTSASRTLLQGRNRWLAIAGAVLAIAAIVVAIQPASFVQAGDSESVHNVTQEGAAHYRETGETLQWSRRIFSGMPYGPAMFYHKFNTSLGALRRLTRPLFDLGNYYTFGFFLGGICLLYLCMSLKLGVAPALAAALIFVLQPAVTVLGPAAHGSKLYSYALFPVLFVFALELAKKGGLLRFAAFSYIAYLMILQLHPQMALYGVAVTVFCLLIWAVRQGLEGAWAKIGKTGLAFALASLLALLMTAFHWQPITDYTPHSIRGQGPLPAPQEQVEEPKGAALDWTYATNWSLHPEEAMTFAVPEAFGFSNAVDYFGWMRFTQAPHYLGVVALVLACFAFVRPYRVLAVALAVAGIFAVLVSFGRFWAWGPYGLLYEYLPFFNRIRVPSMALYATSFSVAVLAALGGHHVVSVLAQPEKRQRVVRGALIGMGVVGLFWIVFGAAGGLSQMAGSQYLARKVGDFAERDARVYAEVRDKLGGWGDVVFAADSFTTIDVSVQREMRATKLIVPTEGGDQEMAADALFAYFLPEAKEAAQRAAEDLNRSLLYAFGTLLAILGACFIASTLGAASATGVGIGFGLVCALLVFNDFQRANVVVLADPPQNNLIQVSPGELPRDMAFLVSQQRSEAPFEPFRLWPYLGYEDPNYFPGCGLESIEGYSPFKLRRYQNVRDLVADNPHAYERFPALPNMLNARYVRSVGGSPPRGFDTELVFEDIQIVWPYPDALTMTNQRGEQLRLAPRLSVALLDQRENQIKIATRRTSGIADTGWVRRDAVARVHIYENKDALPRAWFASQVLQAKSDKQARDMLIGLDPHTHAIVQQDIGTLPAGPVEGGIRIDAYEPYRTALTVKNDRRALLVLSEITYPAWQLFVDGEPRDDLVVNYLLRGVVLEPGEHQVEWRYDQGSYQRGQLLSTVSSLVWWALFLGGLFLWWKRRQAVGETAEEGAAAGG